MVEYGLTNEETRKEERIVGKLRNEMNKNYGINANGQVANNSSSIMDYVSDIKTLNTINGDLQYRELEIIVASQQEGGKYTTSKINRNEYRALTQLLKNYGGN